MDRESRGDEAMGWMEALKKAINYIEEHLLEELTVEEVAREVYLSPFYFQKGFKMITGYTVGEYVRNRRLYLAALELSGDGVKVIDVAYKYGYDTPESFTKAFTRFHGMSPMQLKGQRYNLTPFYPLQLEISIKGGNKLDVCLEQMEAFKVIGFSRFYRYDTAFDEIPGFWKEYLESPISSLLIQKYCIGSYGICRDVDANMKKETFKYMIAGPYHGEGEEIPKGLSIEEIPALTWAKFRGMGPMPHAIQNLNTRIYKEWLPNNPEYEFAEGYNIEMYSSGDQYAADYISEVWIPIRKR